MVWKSAARRRTRFARTVLGAAVMSSGVGVLLVGNQVQAETATTLNITAVQCPDGTVVPTAAAVTTVEIPAACQPVPNQAFVLPSGTQLTGSNGVTSWAITPGTFTITPAPFGPNSGGLARLRCNGDATPDTDATETVTYVVGAGTSNCVAYYVGTPGLTVTKTGPTTAAPGTTVRYVITISNTGQGTVFNAVLNDVASGLGTPTIVVQPQYLIDAGQACTGFPCSLWFINPGAVKTFEITYVVPPCLPPGTMTNTASVSGSNVTTVTAVATTTNTNCSTPTSGVVSTTTSTSIATTTPTSTATTVVAATTTIVSATTTAAPAATTTIGQTQVTSAPVATTTTPAGTPTAAAASAATTASATTSAPTAAAPTTAAAVVTVAPAPVANVAGEQITNAEPIAFTGPRTSAVTALAAGILLVLGLMLIVSAQMPALGRRRF